ncbi:MAG: flagellar hook associated protein [Proteobacteria bacterium]|nr:MAG: flagellar hook associated protein [Pseudomonadota bacterium]
MSGIKFGSINTGLPPNIVEQLMEAERIPIANMQNTKSKFDAKSKLVDELSGKIGDIRKGLGELANTRGFTDIKLTSADPNQITGTVDPNSYQPGNWNIEVMALAEKASAVTNGFPDKDKTKIGTGYFRFKTENGDKDVYVPKKENTLNGAMKAINEAKVGVKASIINDRKDPDAPFKLVMASENTGQDKSVEYPRIYMLDGDQDIFFDKEIPAKNGVVKVDGFEFEIADNVLKDAIPGVSLELKQAKPGTAVNITVKEDLEVVSGKIKTFVDGMNGVLAFLQTQNKLDKSTDTTKTLGGDSIIRNVEQRFRSLIQNQQLGVKGNIKTLSQLGIAFNRQGTLDFDQKKFNAALNTNPSDVQQFFVGDGYATGFVAGVKREIASLLNPSTGAVATKGKNLKGQSDAIDQRIVQKERQLEKKEQILRDKFSRLEETMSKIKSQGGAVSAMGGGGGLAGVG